MDYLLMQPPFEVKIFKDMSKKRQKLILIGMLMKSLVG